MSTYRIARSSVTVSGQVATLLSIGFADPAQNDQICKDAATKLKELENAGELGGGIVLVNGPASLPVAMVIAHAVAHRYEAVACFDPKLGSYVVAICHGGRFQVGDLIPQSEVDKSL